eukprot:m.53319 g.53319  ORF g.53319 m.53319 type:complete len:393 (-) comp11038_c0_seq1:38-1216(-)
MLLRSVFTSARRSANVSAAVCTRAVTTDSLNPQRLCIEPLTSPRPIPSKETLQFGKKFSDHMLVCDWTSEGGWADPLITQYANFSLEPSAIVFHYALECFEGMKAYRGDDDRVRLFRPEMNAERFLKSSKRLNLPAFNTEEFVDLLKALVKQDSHWVPQGRGYSLYVRPTHIATSPMLGVSPPDQSRLFVINSPVGAYYSTGFKPVKLLADPQFVRAWPGGMGDTKCGGNYAPTIQPQRYAAEQGCQQVLWLFDSDHKVTEVGTMNLFMFWKNEDGDDELITAPLDGTILAGVTRNSVIELAEQWGEFKVTEKYFTMPQVVRALKENRVYEIFGTGTAATVSPVGEIVYDGATHSIPLDHDGNIGKLANRVVDTVFDIQYGVVEHEWAPVIE